MSMCSQSPPLSQKGLTISQDIAILRQRPLKRLGLPSGIGCSAVQCRCAGPLPLSLLLTRLMLRLLVKLLVRAGFIRQPMRGITVCAAGIACVKVADIVRGDERYRRARVPYHNAPVSLKQSGRWDVMGDDMTSSKIEAAQPCFWYDP